MRQKMSIEVPKGLEGVEVDVTKISLVDGERGRLSYRGHDVSELIDWPFTRVVLLVLTGNDPSNAERRAFETALARAAALSDSDAALLTLAAQTPTHPMAVLQGLIPLLSKTAEFADYGDAAHGFTVAAKLPALIAGLHRLRSGSTLPPPNAELDPNARFLTQMGFESNAELAHAFNVTQILQIEHSFNASTFAARVVASTLAPVENVLAAALGALHGALHGGADQAALETALEVGDPDNAPAFVDESLARGRKIMGMGHREYRVLDPRARFVKTLAATLSKGTSLETLYATLEAIEANINQRMAERGTELHANLEFYKGIVYRAAGLPVDYFTAAFAMARVYGYLAHFIESRINNRIIRPAARYIGATPV
ncbi:MAG TPA: citrate/2-methylcitrate synthase [Pseudomonadales bacterium]|nr:citrate/2-methylcitrate synthase [Pseudomonadales bacterium]